MTEQVELGRMTEQLELSGLERLAVPEQIVPEQQAVQQVQGPTDCRGSSDA